MPSAAVMIGTLRLIDLVLGAFWILLELTCPKPWGKHPFPYQCCTPSQSVTVHAEAVVNKDNQQQYQLCGQPLIVSFTINGTALVSMTFGPKPLGQI